MRVLNHRSVQASASAGAVIAASIYLVGANTITLTLATLWVVATGSAIAQATHQG